MSWQEIVRQLHAMYTLPPFDMDEINRLDVKLQKIIGRNYADLTQQQIATAISQ